MAPPRVDLYTPFHKGIRRMLFDLIVTAGRTDFRDEQACAELFAECQRIFGLLREHARIEDEQFHPAIESRAPGATAGADREHVVEEEHMAGIEAHLQRVARAPVEERPGLGLQLYRAISAFCADYLDHLATEEDELMPLFWQHFTDDELAALRGRVQAGLAAERMGEWLRAVLPAFNLDERAVMLGGIRDYAPAPAFDSAAAVACEVLSTDEWQQLAVRLGIARA